FTRTRYFAPTPLRLRERGSHLVMPANHSGPRPRSDTRANTSFGGRSISTLRESFVATRASQHRQDALAGQRLERLLHPGRHVVVRAVVVVAEPLRHVDRRQHLDTE